jgi:hypothetical protein
MSGKWSAWRSFGKGDGRWYRRWREPGSRKLYSQLESRWVWEQAHGPIPPGHEIHHENHDGTDNRLDNLRLVTAEWHDNYHQRLREDHRFVDGVEQRRCQRCQEYRPLGEFDSRAAGTFQGYCHRCRTEYLREWRARNREHHNAYMREWRRRHQEQQAAYYREYRRKRKASGDA